MSIRCWWGMTTEWTSFLQCPCQSDIISTTSADHFTAAWHHRISCIKRVRQKTDGAIPMMCALGLLEQNFVTYLTLFFLSQSSPSLDFVSKHIRDTWCHMQRFFAPSTKIIVVFSTIIWCHHHLFIGTASKATEPWSLSLWELEYIIYPPLFSFLLCISHNSHHTSRWWGMVKTPRPIF